jgi:ketosteroid isomerase-like protein
MSHENMKVVLHTFDWFNAVMANPSGVITRAQVEERFTPDAKMIANGQTKCAGIDAHLAHFKELQKKLKFFRIRLPLELWVSGQDKCAAYYLIDYTTRDDGGGVIHDSALWTIRDGRIAQMVETVFFAGREVPLDNHA